ncbi:putative intracellular protease/amidase [Catenulispora sp. GP43]|uniref:type 1 glutamine amidotransferase domain-containing protein n=1 Tax=Catenulispora sp. GP43 TaxID=3156263 RepID=UPI0035158697
MTKVLMVVTAADRWTLRDDEVHPSGYWGEELAMPHKIFTEAGWDITIATPGGTVPTLDKLSMAFTAGWPGTLREVAKYLEGIKAQLDRPEVLAHMDPDEFDLVFYPGGHGPMEDLAVDPVSGALLTRALHSGTPLALLCHGPAATFAAENADGSWPFAGYRMTALSNFEEKLNSFGRRAKWLLEDRLCADGARYEKGRIPLRPFTVVDRNLYTGQNPASATHLARRLVADLGSVDGTGNRNRNRNINGMEQS